MSEFRLDKLDISRLFDFPSARKENTVRFAILTVAYELAQSATRAKFSQCRALSAFDGSQKP
jgi:hypothetical protein